MFGMEKKKTLFEFDLESELKKDPKKKQALLKNIEGKTQQLKTALREGSSSEHFDHYGVLLHAYGALQRVINRVTTNPQGGS
ncbi:MAG: DUF5398 domain-containing protein [Rhabdochlamydiaceae bacterium]|nr:DUF5398 domain-containing protein [Rhabdochlamydiaceae bacterium]